MLLFNLCHVQRYAALEGCQCSWAVYRAGPAGRKACWRVTVVTGRPPAETFLRKASLCVLPSLWSRPECIASQPVAALAPKHIRCQISCPLPPASGIWLELNRQVLGCSTEIHCHPGVQRCVTARDGAVAVYVACTSQCTCKLAGEGRRAHLVWNAGQVGSLMLSRRREISASLSFGLAVSASTPHGICCWAGGEPDNDTGMEGMATSACLLSSPVRATQPYRSASRSPVGRCGGNGYFVPAKETLWDCRRMA